jgi:drug/metabolite transporter (DMT)-like permease
MSGEAIGLLLGAAAIHAGWNFLAKRAGDRLSFLWLGIGAGLALYAPVMVWTAVRDPAPAAGYPFIVASGAIHFFYYHALARMYEYDFSLTYPIARGASPILVTVLSLAVLGEPLSAGGIAGILIVVAGIAVLRLRPAAGASHADAAAGVSPAAAGVSPAVSGPAVRLALATAVIIAAYSVVDKTGVATMRVNPVFYLWMTHLIAFIALAPRMIRRWPDVAAEARRAPGAVLAVGLGQNLAYILVLFAMRLSPVAYVVPVREVSTLVGAALGVVLLKEPFPAAKLGGAALIVAGVAIIAILG